MKSLCSLLADIRQTILFDQYEDFVSKLTILLADYPGDDPRIEFADKSTPLTLAISRGRPRHVRHLITSQVGINQRGTDHVGRREPPLTLSLRLHSIQMANWLLQCKDLNVNQRDLFRWTPLAMAIGENLYECAVKIIHHSRFEMNPLPQEIFLKHSPPKLQFLINAGYSPAGQICPAYSTEDCHKQSLKQLCRSHIRTLLLIKSRKPILANRLAKLDIPTSLKQYLSNLTIDP